MGCYTWYSVERTRRGCSPPRPLLGLPNVTAHPSTASVPITILMYSGVLLCGFNVAIKGLTELLALALLVNTINSVKHLFKRLCIVVPKGAIQIRYYYYYFYLFEIPKHVQ